jgi:pimeloyl-ACP methyl ester carboxylesterase
MRMPVWLETVPALLRAVQVKHVALVTHSAGTMYTLNTLLQHRGILDAKTPYVAYLGT